MTSETLRPPDESTARALGENEWVPSGKCLNFVWWCIDGVTSAGYPDANTALADVNVLHEGDRNPPPGVPCYWTGSTYGHVALSLGGGNVRSTDYPNKEDVSTVSIDKLTSAWGRHYEGWAEDYNDTPIPGVGEDDMPSAEEIAAAVWRYDQNGDASQAWSYQRDGAKKVWQYSNNNGPQAWSYESKIDDIETQVTELVTFHEEITGTLADVQREVTMLAEKQGTAIERLAEAIEWLAGRRHRRDDANPNDDEHGHPHWPHRHDDESNDDA